MNSPVAVEIDLGRGAAAPEDHCEEEQGSIFAALSGDTKDTNISAVTFADSAGLALSTNKSEGTARKINRHDVKQIFRGSTTKGAVSLEQLERIQKMHDKISDGVNWDFNYNCLLVVASVVAGLGLALDSSTTVISSMLLSPIMGPVIGISYGAVIWDLPLIYRSARNELISVALCVVFGVIIGKIQFLCTASYCIDTVNQEARLSCNWTEMADEWPTQEMLSRGTRTTFLAGIPIAFFSGLGVALSVLDDQTSSLVGVAISASLLPPAVNCGMLLIVALLKGEEWSDFTMEHMAFQGSPNFSQMAIMSLFLTIANVIMVALGATLMFRAKEVLPVNKKIFWDDLKIARRIYQGRAINSATGGALTVEELRLAYDNQRVDDVPKNSDDPTQ
ncbi:hypothetical protein ACHAXR_003090 [Thalassiosira sp. AJA248-18]